ncbi:MAG: DUF4255 domain-containing protein [Microcoleus sp. SU_5_3]|nr:DUF4255 domain-containing protein [Microcoleus sp. SU_5_3]
MAIQEEVYGARVTTDRPNKKESGLTESCLNIYLYMVQQNTAYRNSDSSLRRPKGELVKRTQSALDLRYLFSFHGNDIEFEPQRMLGCVIRTLQDVFTITPEMIRDTLADPTSGVLAGADLPDQIEPIHISPIDISVEDMSKIWSVFFQTPYSLSTAYKGSIVLIEGEAPGTRALPVRDRRSLVMPFSQIFIERIVSQTGKLEPIFADSTLLIIGRNLQESTTLVRIGGVEIEVQPTNNTEIIFPLSLVPPDLLRFGAQSLQVVHPGPRLHLVGPYQGIESNLAAFVLRPTIKSVQVYQVRVSGNNTYSAEVTLTLNLPVDKGKIVALILNEWSIESPVAYIFKTSIRREEEMEITIPVQKVKAGDYLVRVQVDGAESPLIYDTDSTSPTFNWYVSPRITI